ncbi:putative membrane protein [Streptomyces davaonensis JCM 4913]|uniref:Putative membrane protein n=2 Tax=Streptomyces davaonensis TaxID=348043 RepID=K4QUP4_STRDJ|nr:putative membrane protein [Streptomyces davaonensis JCM 4913]
MPERQKVRARFWAETACAGLSAILAIMTAFTREWIELLFGVDPDGGNGSLESALVVLFAVAACVFGLVARAERRRAAPA